jgi:hypothetical protein
MRLRSSQDISTPQEISSTPLKKSAGECFKDFHDSMSAVLACRKVDQNLLASFGVSEDLTQEAIQLEEDRALDAKDRLALKSEVLESKKRERVAVLENDLKELVEDFDYIGNAVHAIFSKLVSYINKLDRGESVSQEDCSNIKEGIEICKMAVTLCEKLRTQFKKKIDRLMAIDGSPKILENPKVKKVIGQLY